MNEYNAMLALAQMQQAQMTTQIPAAMPTAMSQQQQQSFAQFYTQLYCQQLLAHQQQQKQFATLFQQLAAAQTNTPIASPAIEAPKEVEVKPEVSAALPFTSTANLEIKPQASTENVVTIALLTPEATPSPAEVLDIQHRPSPTTSASTRKSNDADEEDDFYIDVEEFDDKESKESGKGRRQAHVEFFRKVKALRHRPELKCTKCGESIANNDAAITEHIHSHAPLPSFKCLVCGWQCAQRRTMYDHTMEQHPKRAGAFADKRDMRSLCTLIGECFPRATAKNSKQSLHTMVESMVKQLRKTGIDKIKCKKCSKHLSIDQSALTRHLQAHPAFRCKTCKFVTDTVDGQEKHHVLEHEVQSAKLSVHFNTCTAIDVTARTLQRCFGDLL